MKKISVLILHVILLSSARGDCFDDAASWQGVHAGVLRAISIRENARCDATLHVNTNGTVDIGCMQINSIHLPELAAYGISAKELLDSCINIFVGARHYKKMVLKYGNTWKAVGAYHSQTPARRDAYARSVEAIFRRLQTGQIKINSSANSSSELKRQP